MRRSVINRHAYAILPCFSISDDISRKTGSCKNAYLREAVYKLTAGKAHVPWPWDERR